MIFFVVHAMAFSAYTQRHQKSRLHLDKTVKISRGDHFSFYSFGFHPTTKEYKVAHFLSDRHSVRNTLEVLTNGKMYKL
jgi:hypothetical protein